MTGEQSNGQTETGQGYQSILFIQFKLGNDMSLAVYWVRHVSHDELEIIINIFIELHYNILEYPKIQDKSDD